MIVVHETKVEEFIDYTKVFIIQCIKKINSEVPHIRRAAVRVFASMINSIFIKVTLSHILNLMFNRIHGLNLFTPHTFARSTKKDSSSSLNSKTTRTLTTTQQPRSRLT